MVKAAPAQGWYLRRVELDGEVAGEFTDPTIPQTMMLMSALADTAEQQVTIDENQTLSYPSRALLKTMKLR